MFSRRAFLGQAAAFAAMPQSDKKIRLAVVGGGFGATFHFHEHPNCVVTAVTDLYAERRKRLRDHYKCDSVYDSMEDMLAKRRDLDAVAVFSGAVDHVKHVKTCMERGLHVCCAVPAAMSLEGGGATARGEGKDGTAVHDGGIELLPAGGDSCPESVQAGCFR